MDSYIPKQIKPNRDRIEVKLERELIEQLERYCRYLESDREYVIAQLLSIAFKKDKGFAAWLARNPARVPVERPEPQATPRAGREGR
jgi:hypothetical protein